MVVRTNKFSQKVSSDVLKYNMNTLSMCKRIAETKWVSRFAVKLPLPTIENGTYYYTAEDVEKIDEFMEHLKHDIDERRIWKYLKHIMTGKGDKRQLGKLY